MNVTHLECANCGLRHEARVLQNLCNTCGKPLLVRYDLERAAQTLTREALRTRESSLWRYREVLPVESPDSIVSFGEGWTPLLRADRLASKLPIKLNLFIKDEGQNPTQSFKARGMTAAVSMAKELGVKKLAVPSAGNAAGALAAYAARAGMEANIFMPSDTPRANIVECRQTGANVTLIDGLITDCGKIVAERKDVEGWFDVSTLKEPYRVEGKKTMGYELAEQLNREPAEPVRTGSGSDWVPADATNWKLPNVIIYPTGGGTGLIGMWKAFDEMQQMGWIGPERPRMISVQSATCARRSCGPSRTENASPTNSRTPRPSLRACASPKPSATSSSSTPSANPAELLSRSRTTNFSKPSARSAAPRACSVRLKGPLV